MSIDTAKAFWVFAHRVTQKTIYSVATVQIAADTAEEAFEKAQDADLSELYLNWVEECEEEDSNEYSLASPYAMEHVDDETGETTAHIA